MESLLSIRNLEKLSSREKVEYFSNLRDYCISLNKRDIGKNRVPLLFSKIFPLLRNYGYFVEGIENLPDNGCALFVCNHSNSHDFFTAQELFRMLGKNVSVLSADDDLNFATATLFKICEAVLIDRNDKNSTSNGIFEMAANLICGNPAVIFGEATWNLHPLKTMHQIKIGASEIAAIAQAPIIPTIFEYVEVPSKCFKEKDLFYKCIIKFGEPIFIYQDTSLINQTNIIQKKMEDNRRDLWGELGINKNSIRDIDVELYLNHTYLKKYGAFGFDYDSKAERGYLFSKDGNLIENEYRIDDYGNFVPGVTTKEEGKKYIRK